MKQNIIIQVIFFVRILLSCGCGAVIGYERRNRGKVAGLRTHIMVALGSSLMMIISKYGFSDVGFYGCGTPDSARIAAQIVSGIGFLGAGMIFIHDRTVQGLTTAAGIWTTAGIGMAIGSGMYAIGVASTVLIIIVQIILHKNFRFLHNQSDEHVTVIIKNESGNLEKLRQKMISDGIHIVSVSFKRIPGNLTEVELFISVSPEFDISCFAKYDDDYIVSISE